MIHHPRFDLTKFTTLFDLQAERVRATRRAESLLVEQKQPVTPETVAERAALIGPRGDFITSPYQLAIVEQLRTELLGGKPPIDPLPCDAFVFGIGEPIAPYLTKIGGHPYRPRLRPWPKTKDGRDRLFIAQLCVIDSRDLAPDAEGDVLIVFADPENLFGEYALEWVTIGEGELLTDADVPKAWYTTHTGNPFTDPTAKAVRVPVPTLRTVHGVIHRTWDVAVGEPRFDAVGNGDRLASIEGTKIGGVAVDIQSPSASDQSLFAAIGSVQPVGDTAYPWVNQETPISRRDVHRLHNWMLGDMGTLNVFRDERGGLVARGDAY